MSNYYCVNLSYCLALKSCKGSACASSFGNEVTIFLGVQAERQEAKGIKEN